MKPKPPEKRRDAGVKPEVLERLERHLDRLGLTELKSSLDGHLGWAQERKPSHAEFLERVFESCEALLAHPCRKADAALRTDDCGPVILDHSSRIALFHPHNC